MERSPEIADLAAALAKAQGQMSNAAKDGQVITPKFRYRYASLASIWDACREPLSANGLAVSQDAEVLPEGVRISTLLMHATGQFLSNQLTLPCVTHDEKGVGTAITYARRYALSALVGVAPDDDAPSNGGATGPSASAELLAECRRLSGMLGQTELVDRAYCARSYGTDEPARLTQTQAEQWATHLRAELARLGLVVATDLARTHPAAAPPVDGTSATGQTLQSALADQQRTGEAAAAAANSRPDQMIARLHSARDGYLELAGLGDVTNPATQKKRLETWHKILAKRGLRPLDEIPSEVCRELTETFERRVVELTEQRRAAGVTCAAKAGPPETVGAKSA